MTEIIINLPVLVTAIFLIVFVLLHKKIEKKLDLTILILVASIIFLVNLKMVWITVFLLAFVYFGIKYTYKAKKG
ncbi:hypothetical protein [Bacillus sp. 005/A4HT-01/001]|uniref:hypothetical protein n=1 Tax=Bacillus sp. 005/A4HT-01/001 TaxID=2509010 RepID=UPI0010753D4B|nr:hypothetical protein [Bacillus sp. 005/A4HT-01/001]TFW45527.1 hypothetical protein ES896_19895 [Bacillus sp. 005/A4HT-01/001]